MKLGFLNLLTLIFVIAKLFGQIDWSWWLVFAPTIISGVLAIFAILVVSFVAAVKRL